MRRKIKIVPHVRPAALGRFRAKPLPATTGRGRLIRGLSLIVLFVCLHFTCVPSVQEVRSTRRLANTKGLYLDRKIPNQLLFLEQVVSSCVQLR